jgi:hypothetical protein
MNQALLMAERPAPEILPGLFGRFSRGEMTLADVEWEQQRFHEHRRWNAVELVEAVNLNELTEADRIYILNFARAELTTKPGADRLAGLCDRQCRKWLSEDENVAKIIQACGTWSRYWNEEEAHHEAALTYLLRRLDFEPVTDEMFLEYRQIFPDDDMLRTLFLLTMSEVKTTVMYTSMANKTRDPGLKALFRQIATDEAHHMRYFNTFARGLVDSGKYTPKGAFAIAHFFLREGGEMYGYARDTKEARGTHVNWWDQLDFRSAERPDDFERQRKLTYASLEQSTGISVSTPQEVQDTWLGFIA